MPMKCIHSFNYMMNFLTAVCNTDVILCTATQPTLGETGCPICYGEPKYMIKNAAHWFRVFERVKISVPEGGGKYTFERLREEIMGQTQEYRSILVVLNTKSAVKRLYDLLKQSGIRVEYLTTNLCAEHRSDRIKAIKTVLTDKKESIVVVSTNLIEAGVDISFECVYRSMAGLDSLAQTAGRCNRNGEADCGEVRLFLLDGENSGGMEELQQSIRATEEVLDKYMGSREEGSLLTPVWMNHYYESIYSMTADKMNFPMKDLDNNVMELLSRGFSCREKKNSMNQAYKTVGQAYRVIDDCSFGVIVPYGRGAKLIETIREAERESEIKACIRQAQRFTVNVRGSLLRQYEGLIQPVCNDIPGLYMVVSSGSYSEEYGIAPEWETLIF
ncbi:UvrABC system protein B [Lachnospiraceae bacterium]|nr:UvrABC system protein B [Lachnospiraceae bacterium]